MSKRKRLRCLPSLFDSCLTAEDKLLAASEGYDTSIFDDETEAPDGSMNTTKRLKAPALASRYSLTTATR